jgi:regulator of cell morphogenesis and NO signaling
MTGIDPRTTLAELVVADPRRARLLERLRLDYCCGGDRTLGDACVQRGLDPATVVTLMTVLADDLATDSPEPHDVARATIGQLCDHIVKAHHVPLRRRLPNVADQLATVVRAHGARHRELHDLRRVFEGMRYELEDHLALEEATLFPACRAVEADVGARVDLVLLAAHEADHVQVGEALVALRELSGGYLTKVARCGAHRALLQSLHALELDLHQHIHEENNILFPRVRALAVG